MHFTKTFFLLLLGLALSGCGGRSTENIPSYYNKPDLELLDFDSMFGDGYDFHIFYSQIDDEYSLEFFTEEHLVTSYDVKVCSPESTFKCFISDYLTFGVPSTFSTEEKEWRIDGYRFEIVGTTEIIYKRSVETFYSINGINENKGLQLEYIDRFVYNPKAGLVMFSRIRVAERENLNPEFHYPVFKIRYSYDRYGTLDKITSLIP